VGLAFFWARSGQAKEDAAEINRVFIIAARWSG
jgi:hypothetical protein